MTSDEQENASKAADVAHVRQHANQLRADMEFQARMSTPSKAQPEAVTKISVHFDRWFTFEASGRESVVMDAYKQALKAFVEVTPRIVQQKGATAGHD